MAPKRGIRRRQCERKVRYDSVQSASKAWYALTSKTGEDFNVYKCKFCKGYHVGHKRGVLVYRGVYA
jgi:hypothetical protein